MRKLSTSAALGGCVCSLFLSPTALVPFSAKAAGVTIITHGLNDSVNGWVAAMAGQMTNYYRFPGTNYTMYEMYFYNNGGNYYLAANLISGGPPSTTDSGEIIVELDWSLLADGNSYNTYQVASAVVPALLNTNFFPGLGHSLVEFPIHLIGHSRGGSLMSQISLLLGTNGVWIDQLTTLDPHPLNNDGFVLDGFLYSAVDAPVHTYENVLFHDNYYQNINFLVHGESVAGAYVRQLTDFSGGGYSSSSSAAPAHSDVHLWYHGTVDSNTPTSYLENGNTITINSMMRTNWWDTGEQYGQRTGFYYSLIGGGDRLNLNPPTINGYNQQWDLGAGTSANRTALSANNGTWPDIIRFNVTGTNVIVAGNPINTTFYYQYAGASNVTFSVYFDRDLNPHDTNDLLVLQGPVPSTGAGSVFYYSNLGLDTTNVPPGNYAVYGEITDGAHTRYLYAPELVEIVSSQQPPVLDIAQLNGGQFVVGVNGVSGQTIALETSADLNNWLPLATNLLTTSRWTYTNSLPADQQFYRAVLNP